MSNIVLDRGNLPSLAELTVVEPLPNQLHDGDFAYGSIIVHLLNDAQENTTYTFSATLEYHQYNETPK